MKTQSIALLLVCAAVLAEAAQRRRPSSHGNAPHRARRASRRSRSAAAAHDSADEFAPEPGYAEQGDQPPPMPDESQQGEEPNLDGVMDPAADPYGHHGDPYNAESNENAALPDINGGNGNGVDTYGGQGGGGANDESHAGNNHLDNEGKGPETDDTGETCELGAWTKYYCSCQKFLVKSRVVKSKETAYGCDELVSKSKKTCAKPSSKCAARAYEVAIDTLDHVEASDNWGNAARAYRLAGGRGLSNSVVTCLSEARNAFEGVITGTGTRKGKKGTRLAAVTKAEAVMKKMLPEANHEAMLTALTPYFDSAEHHSPVGDHGGNADAYGNHAGGTAGGEYGNNGPAGHDEYGGNNHGGNNLDSVDGAAGVHDVAEGDSFEDAAHSLGDAGDAYGGPDVGGRSAGLSAGLSAGRTPGHNVGASPESAGRSRAAGRSHPGLTVDGTTDGDDDTHGGHHGQIGRHMKDDEIESEPRPLGGAARHDAYDEGEEYDEEGNPINGAAARGNILVGGVQHATEHSHSAEISRHPKSSRGDIFFFVVALALLVGVVVLALVTACQNPWLVLLASSMDFWVMTAFYWIDVRLPYNIDHYAEAGLIYDAFAITCVLVLLFAAGRTAVAINHMMARTRSAAWQKLELLTVLGLFAQLTVLCIHVVTTKHASRTTVAGFIGTVLSTVIQTWHLMQNFADKHQHAGLPSHGHRGAAKYGSAARSRRLLNYTRKSQAKQI